MKLSSTRYASMLCIQTFLLIVDIIINAFSIFIKQESIVLLVIFIVQDMCLLFSIILIFLSFFSTFVFQAGLIGILVRRFGSSVILCFTYLILSICLHSWILRERWEEPSDYIWPYGMISLHTVHRVCSALYYYTYKRSMLRIANPRFYQDINWIIAPVN